uniref:Uncharacterized protein n=1 Tax=Glossina pallidipes TaxID=7398 RepID=A0A1A9ZYQ5_GLOPL
MAPGHRYHTIINSTTFSTQTTAVCQKVPLTISRDSILKHAHVTGHRLVSAALSTSYTSLKEFTNLTHKEFVKYEVIKADNYSTTSNQYSAQLNNLPFLQLNLQAIQDAKI